jgi:hypothetical protein
MYSINGEVPRSVKHIDCAIAQVNKKNLDVLVDVHLAIAAAIL